MKFLVLAADAQLGAGTGG